MTFFTGWWTSFVSITYYKGIILWRWSEQGKMFYWDCWDWEAIIFCGYIST